MQARVDTMISKADGSALWDFTAGGLTVEGATRVPGPHPNRAPTKKASKRATLSMTPLKVRRVSLTRRSVIALRKTFVPKLRRCSRKLPN